MATKNTKKPETESTILEQPKIEIFNAEITEAVFGIDKEGQFVALLHLLVEEQQSAQWGSVLPVNSGTAVLSALCAALKVRTLEQIKGQPIRVLVHDNKIMGISRFSAREWFSFEQIIAQFSAPIEDKPESKEEIEATN